jgi:hypothetical protein
MDPNDEREFRAFVAARSPALLHTARLLAPDAHAAEDLLQEALSRRPRHEPRRRRRGDDAERPGLRVPPAASPVPSGGPQRPHVDDVRSVC